jgi:putative ABC transport system permease protein
MGDGRLVWNAPREAAELIADAFREVRAHKLRSILTLSGIVFGTASVVSMTALSAAIKTVASEEMSRMGMPRSFSLIDRGPPSDARTARALQHQGLTITDVGALRDVSGVDRAFARTWGGTQLVTTARDQRTVPIDGVDVGYLSFRNWPIVAGRELVPLDIMNATRVAVIGTELVEPFFGASAPVGQTIEINGIPFLVVGVVAPVVINFIPAEMTFMARRVYIPYTFISRYYLGQSRVNNVILHAGSDHDFASVMQAGEETLRSRHRGADDFRTENEDADLLAQLAMVDDIATGWDVVLFSIAGITLLVGGIGLFSVLLISVRERVREIGIRQALGADDRDIRRLFLAESLTLALLGGTIGIVGGVALIHATESIARGFGRNFAIPLHVPGTFLAALFAIVVGLVFGWYPASRAARLNPIEAIREL